MSLEKAKPLHMKDDLPSLHYPEYVLLTKLCINYFKHIDGAAVLPWLKRTCELVKAAKKKNSRPSVDTCRSKERTCRSLSDSLIIPQ